MDKLWRLYKIENMCCIPMALYLLRFYVSFRVTSKSYLEIPIELVLYNLELISFLHEIGGLKILIFF